MYKLKLNNIWVKLTKNLDFSKLDNKFFPFMENFLENNKDKIISNWKKLISINKYSNNKSFNKIVNDFNNIKEVSNEVFKNYSQFLNDYSSYKETINKELNEINIFDNYVFKLNSVDTKKIKEWVKEFNRILNMIEKEDSQHLTKTKSWYIDILNSLEENEKEIFNFISKIVGKDNINNKIDFYYNNDFKTDKELLFSSIRSVFKNNILNIFNDKNNVEILSEFWKYLGLIQNISNIRKQKYQIKDKMEKFIHLYNKDVSISNSSFNFIIENEIKSSLTPIIASLLLLSQDITDYEFNNYILKNWFHFNWNIEDLEKLFEKEDYYFINFDVAVKYTTRNIYDEKFKEFENVKWIMVKDNNWEINIHATTRLNNMWWWSKEFMWKHFSDSYNLRNNKEDWMKWYWFSFLSNITLYDFNNKYFDDFLDDNNSEKITNTSNIIYNNWDDFYLEKYKFLKYLNSDKEEYLLAEDDYLRDIRYWNTMEFNNYSRYYYDKINNNLNIRIIVWNTIDEKWNFNIETPDIFNDIFELWDSDNSYKSFNIKDENIKLKWIEEWFIKDWRSQIVSFWIKNTLDFWWKWYDVLDLTIDLED